MSMQEEYDMYSQPETPPPPKQKKVSSFPDPNLKKDDP
jgi:hypothetical protein